MISVAYVDVHRAVVPTAIAVVVILTNQFVSDLHNYDDTVERESRRFYSHQDR